MSTHCSHFHGNGLFYKFNQFSGGLYRLLTPGRTDISGDLLSEFFFPIVPEYTIQFVFSISIYNISCGTASSSVHTHI